MLNIGWLIIGLWCDFFFQFMNEKIGGVEGTKLDDEFVEMERVSNLYFGGRRVGRGWIHFFSKRKSKAVNAYD